MSALPRVWYRYVDGMPMADGKRYNVVQYSFEGSPIKWRTMMEAPMRPTVNEDMAREEYFAKVKRDKEAAEKAELEKRRLIITPDEDAKRRGFPTQAERAIAELRRSMK